MGALTATEKTREEAFNEDAYLEQLQWYNDFGCTLTKQDSRTFAEWVDLFTGVRKLQRLRPTNRDDANNLDLLECGLKDVEHALRNETRDYVDAWLDTISQNIVRYREGHPSSRQAAKLHELSLNVKEAYLRSSDNGQVAA